MGGGGGDGVSDGDSDGDSDGNYRNVYWAADQRILLEQKATQASSLPCLVVM